MKDIKIINIWKPDEARFSFFRAPITNKVPNRVMNLYEAGTYIASPQAKEATEQVRRADTPNQARRVKNQQLDYVTFGGVFSRCEDKGLLAESGVICLDFDHLGDIEQVSRTKLLLLEDPYFETLLLFTSPSGDGVKWVTYIDLVRCDYRTWYRALSNYLKQTYGLTADPTGVNISRACYLPHDPEVYVNPSVLTKFKTQS